MRGYRDVVPHPMVDAVFQALDRAGLRWCLLRGEAMLGQASGDVDLLISPADLPRLRHAVGDLGFAPVPAWGYGSHRFFMNYDPAMDGWVKLDVVTDLAFGPRFTLPTGAEATCLERRRRRERRLAVLSDEDAFWALLLHRILDKGSIPEDSAARLRELAAVARAEGPLAAAVDAVCPSGWSTARVLGLAREGGWEALITFGPQLGASWRRRARAAAWRRAAAATIGRWAGRLLRLRYRRGLGVAVLAPDGAGKSTLAQGLRETFAFPTRTLYMGPYQQSDRPERALPPGVGLAVRLCALWGRWLEGAYHRSRGRLVVFDRYVTDALLPPRRPLSRLGRARRWLIGHCMPAPDLMVVLDAPGAVLHQRKSEQGQGVLEAERQAYRTLAQRARRGLVIDATKPADQVRREAAAAVWRAYGQRWGRWRAPRLPGTTTD